MAIPAKRVTIHDIREQDDHHFYVYNRTSAIFKVPTHLMLPHISPDNGDVRTLEIPMTTNPIDMSEWAPKEELLRNSELMKQVQRGTLQLVLTDDAERVLGTPHARLEQDRLEADRLQRISGQGPIEEDNSFRSVLPPEMLAKGAPGDVDPSTLGVSPKIADALTIPLANEAHRVALFRNLVPMMNDADKAFVRNKSSDPEIRALVG